MRRTYVQRPDSVCVKMELGTVNPGELMYRSPVILVKMELSTVIPGLERARMWASLS